MDSMEVFKTRGGGEGAAGVTSAALPGALAGGGMEEEGVLLMHSSSRQARGGLQRPRWSLLVLALLCAGGHGFGHGSAALRTSDGFLRGPSAPQAASTPTRRVPPTHGPPMMVGFLGGKSPDRDREVMSSPEKIPVLIERPTMNSRRISASIVIDRPPEDVWSILTDYNNLATHVPNLVQSRLLDRPGGGLRLYQEGAQKIIGFDFSASLVMDMEEVLDSRAGSSKKAIQFKLVESRFFSEFDGIWQLQVHSRRPIPGTNTFTYTTKLFYEVFIRPNGPVPVLPLEWRIREDVPTNLRGVKTASERLDAPGGPMQPRGTTTPVVDWEAEETLQLYMQDNQ
uniref:Coenzyme Q-binding protein COQ10 START domain-containing protein n=1 Tax=Rhizochromulina marina TaxID=1034831 RepID=A0A7S2SEL4_9STRA|mmetsp:Transcript_29089/g.84928  ORF Transcript_29089/g.84928 Transcript_29089/m.84928 type:complete len:340 (+) Transcript_29089:172-1191(+)